MGFIWRVRRSSVGVDMAPGLSNAPYCATTLMYSVMYRRYPPVCGKRHTSKLKSDVDREQGTG